MESAEPGERQVGPPPSLVFLLSKVGYAASRSFAACLEPLGLEARHFAVLNFIALDEGQSQQTLADALDIPASRMVAIVDELEHRGFIERRPHPTDRRARALYLTPAGETHLHEAREVVQANESDFCQQLDPGTREHLIAVLTPLAARQGIPFGVHPGLTDKTQT
jgi:DNA-binding MarR family transcriptional regulator